MSLESAGTVSFAHRCHLRVAPAKHHAKIRLFVADADVPDPYYGGAAGFQRVLDLVEEHCRSLLGLNRTTS
jgi:protein-tyrosine-phosphatase